MAAPSSPDEFLDLVRKSSVVDEKRLDTYLQRVRNTPAFPQDLGKLAGVLVRDGILTHFQAEQFLQGKWRRFTIGKYKVLERLGSGGMGSVYLCEHKFMRRRVAVKVLPAAKADDPAALERFYREARAVAALDHPNIVRAYDIDQDEKLHFLVMEYVDGVSFQEVIKKHGPMDITRTAHYLAQASIGLQHAHQTAGLVHRDIKPGNVLVDRNGVVKILDMGLARFFHDEEDILTKKYDENVLGTADYLAPEQALDSHSVDIRADIYSLGATCYFVLTGCTLFMDGTVAQKLIWHQTRQPKPIRQIRPEVPEGIAAIVEKMMAKNPADRYQIPSEITQALAPWTQTPIPPPPEKEMPRLSPAAMGSDSTISQVTMAPTPAPTPAQRPAQTAARPNPVQPTPMPAAPVRRSAVARPAPGAAPARPATAPQPAVSQANVATPTPLNTPKPVPTRPAQAPVRAAGAVAPAPKPAPAPQPASAQTEEAPNWGQIAPAPDNSSKLRRPSDASPIPPVLLNLWTRARKLPHFWYIVAGIFGTGFLIFIILVFLLLSWLGGGSAAKKVSATERNALTLVVSQNGAGSYKSVTEALKEAGPGDKIVVKDEKVEGRLVLEERAIKNLTIESGLEGKKVVWSCPDKPSEGRFISVVNAEGLRLKGFILDARNQAPEAVRIAGNCAGLILEDLQITNFTRTGLVVSNCQGSSEAPVTLFKVRIVAGGDKESAVYLHARPNGPSNRDLRFSDCRFEGNYKVAAVLIEGAMADVSFKRNRFFNAETGFYYRPGGKPHSRIDLTLESNTFAKIRRGLYFENVLNLTVKNHVALKNNLFVETAVLAQLDRFLVPNGVPPGTVGKCIWTQDHTGGDAPSGNRFFRQAFTTPNKHIGRALLDVGVDDAVTVWLNGKEVLRQNIGRVQAYDVTGLLIPGKQNVLAAQAFNATGPAALLIQLIYESDGEQPARIGTSEKWKCNVNAPPREWLNPDFNDQGWPGSKVVSNASDGPFRDWQWDSNAPNQIRKAYRSVLDIGKNVCDMNSHEGSVAIHATALAFPALPVDPARDDFLVYPVGSPLNKLPNKPGYTLQ